MVAPEPYWEKIRRLREEAGLAQHKLPGVSLGTVRALEKPYKNQRNGVPSPTRYPSVATLEQVAEGLGVPPDIFDEYRLAKARQQLDERQTGLAEAVDRLDRITEALLLLAAERSATTTRRQAERRRTLEATPPEDETQGADG